jgi:hypothetical protein
MSDIDMETSTEASSSGVIATAQIVGLLSLPVEIRLKIFFYALQRRSFFGGDFRGHIIQAVLGEKQRKIHRNGYNSPYWGPERMTRLLRVCKQIHDEAEGVLYRNFIIDWPQFACACSVPVLLSKRSPRFKELVRFIAVRLRQDEHNHRGAWTLRQRQMKQQALYKALLAELPALRSVSMSVSFVGRGPIDEAKKGMLVDNIVRLAGVFRDIDKLELSYLTVGPDGTREQIVREARERIRRKD